jgi:hypothetical protein
MTLLERVMTIARERARSHKIGRVRSAAVRAKISRAMKGQSNFEGHSHTASTKRVMSKVRGHSDQGKVGGTHWYKPTAYTHAKPDRRAHGAPQGYSKGRGA